MTTYVVEWLENSGFIAIGLSLALSILISILAVIPSFFITAANITFFGFQQGLVLSIIGEALGAIISFFLYRQGLNKLTKRRAKEYKYVGKLQRTKGLDAFCLIVALRIFPFLFRQG